MDSCDIHLNGTVVDPNSIKEVIAEKREEILSGFMDRAKRKPTPAELAELKRDFDSAMALIIEDGVDAKVKSVHDSITQMRKVHEYTHDMNGNPLKTLSEVINRRYQMTMGRNSADTKARALRDHIRTRVDSFETMYRTRENPEGLRSIRELEKGSENERSVYIRVRQMEKEIDVSKLDSATVDAMLKDATPVDRLAFSIASYNAYNRKLLKEYGISTKYSSKFVVKRRYDYSVLSSPSRGATPEACRETFVNDVLQHIDKEATFGKKSDAEIREMIAHTYDDIADNANIRLDPTNSRDFVGNRANSYQTKFIWKDDNAAYEAFTRFSEGGLKEQMEESATAMANKAISIREFGYNAEEVMAKVSQDITASFRGQTPNMRDSFRLARIAAAQKELMGTQKLATSEMTTWANNARFFQAAFKLGNAVTTAMLDAVDTGRQAFYVNGELFGGISEYIQTFGKVAFGMSEADRLALATDLGTVYSYMSNAEGMRLASTDSAVSGGAIDGFIKKNGNKIMNVSTLLPWQTARSNITSTIVGANNLKRIVDDLGKSGGDFTKLNKFQKDTLKEYGFTANDMRILGSDFLEKINTWGGGIVTGNNIRQTLMTRSPESIAKAFNMDADVAADSMVKLADKVDAFLNDFSTRGTPKPELQTKVLMGKTVENEGVRVAIGLMTQFLDTPIAQGQYVGELIEKLSRINGGNRMGILKDSAIPSATYIATGMSMYLAYDGMMSLVMNKQSIIQKMNQADDRERTALMLNVLDRTGYFPFAASLIEKQFFGRYNENALDAFGSPVLGSINDVLNMRNENTIKAGIRRNLPMNAIPLRMTNNWLGKPLDSILETPDQPNINFFD